jgi:NAD(P)-dependent dehydrogenase (short-subunit alcohol dehydrogenase family)
MMIRQTWFVTGAASHLGADIVRQALAAGHCVVAADADPLAVLRRVGNVADERLLALPLDEVDAYEVGIAVKAAVARFGGIDVLVHGAAACSPQGEFDAPAPPRDFSASVRALFNVTRGVLEPMREQCAGPHPPPGAGAGHAARPDAVLDRRLLSIRWPRTWRRSASRCPRCRRIEAPAAVPGCGVGSRRAARTGVTRTLAVILRAG